MTDLPYQAEYAKSGRAACKGCKQKIDQGALRIAIMVQVSHAVVWKVAGKKENVLQKHMVQTLNRSFAADFYSKAMIPGITYFGVVKLKNNIIPLHTVQ